MIVTLSWDTFMSAFDAFPDTKTFSIDPNYERGKELLAAIMHDVITLDEVFQADDAVFRAAYELLNESEDLSPDVQLLQDQLEDEVASAYREDTNFEKIANACLRLKGVPTVRKECEFI